MNSNDFANSLIRRGRKPEDIRRNRIPNQENNLPEFGQNKPEKFIRPVMVNTRTAEVLDSKIINYELYNSFNYSLFLPEGQNAIRCSLGITSPNAGEGKTTSACNLAAAIAMGSNRKTVLVDLNFKNPSIHQIFGVKNGPGLSEALLGEEIFVTPTLIENLCVMTAGQTKIIPVKRFSYFNEIATALMHEFEFLIVDMPPVTTRSFPTLIANQLTGLIVVVESRKTKRRDIDRILRQVNERNVIGFVINKIIENDF